MSDCECRAELRKAVLDKGNHPRYHDMQAERLRDEWPTLYWTIQKIIHERN